MLGFMSGAGELALLFTIKAALTGLKYPLTGMALIRKL